MADRKLVIDQEHPWPWLEAYTADAARFFNGREQDVENLLRCVLSAPATVFFGKSGLGKTSVIQAGLTSRLKEKQLLPVVVRLDHRIDISLSIQLHSRLIFSCREQDLLWCGEAVPSSFEDSTLLWELLHDRKWSISDRQGKRWTPVFLLDQFEEIFTLQNEPAKRQAVFDELGDLVEGRVPPSTAARLNTDDDLIDRIDPDRLGARFVLSLREDYLPDLETWADRIPRLGPNRYRLLPMTCEQGLAAIDKTGGELVSTLHAHRIVEFLDQQGFSSFDPTRPRPNAIKLVELIDTLDEGVERHGL